MRGQYCSSGIFLIVLTIFGLSSAQLSKLMPEEFPEDFIIHVGGGSSTGPSGTKWAVLVAGSMGYGNYRHQVNTTTFNYNFFFDQHLITINIIQLYKKSNSVTCSYCYSFSCYVEFSTCRWLVCTFPKNVSLKLVSLKFSVWLSILLSKIQSLVKYTFV